MKALVQLIKFVGSGNSQYHQRSHTDI
uniref:Uncharacterized protein n=1 Tax=Rhizophora mucronata TaxID=61149 RepID=A0A2P2N9T3_RHIMU